MSIEAFEAWWKSSRNFVESPDHTFYFSLTAWQACEAQHEKEIAALQARIKELEDAFRELKSEAWLVPVQQLMYRGNNVVKRANEVLSTSTPGQALQRALLDARIDELGHNFISDSKSMRAREKELRAQHAELGE